jgi:hypothetical protein
MTCIVGLVDKGNVYIGADSAGISGHSLALRADEKVFFNGGFIFGFTTSFRMGNLLRYKLVVPKPPKPEELVKYMNTDFIDAVRACLKEGGFNRVDNNVDSGGTFLVGHAGRLFSIESDYQVAESLNLYQACGCGADLALGSLYATPGKRPLERIRIALEAAVCHSSGVAKPFTIECLKGLK